MPSLPAIRMTPYVSNAGNTNDVVSYEKDDYRKVSELGTHLDLMLNLDEPEQKALWDVAERLFRTKDKDQRVLMDPELMAAGRVVLKKEWQKIKLEQQGRG